MWVSRRTRRNASSRFGLPGIIISSKGIDKVRVLAELKPPQNIDELRAFLGLTGWFRPVINGESSIAEPFTIPKHNITLQNLPWFTTRQRGVCKSLCQTHTKHTSFSSSSAPLCATLCHSVSVCATMCLSVPLCVCLCHTLFVLSSSFSTQHCRRKASLFSLFWFLSFVLSHGDSSIIVTQIFLSYLSALSWFVPHFQPTFLNQQTSNIMC